MDVNYQLLVYTKAFDLLHENDYKAYYILFIEVKASFSFYGGHSSVG